MRIKYNAPVTLTFAVVCSAILALDQLVGTRLIRTLFSVPGKEGFSFTYLPSYIRLFTHAAGHSDWSHLLGNFAFILLLGPILEEKYGSLALLGMMFITAFITGLINVLLFTTSLLGASGIVFMMILLISFTNIREGEIPLTFILVIALFLVKEVISSFEKNYISEAAHIIGGICGSLFGFSTSSRRRKAK